MISGSFTIRMYIARYDFRILCLKKVYAWYDFRILCHKNVILESLNLRLSYGCLRMCFYTSWQNFANVMSPAQMAMPARTVSKFCARTRSECPDIFFLDLMYFWNHRTLVWMFTWPDWHLCPIGPIALNFQRLPDSMVCPIDRLLSPDWDRLGVRRPD